MGSLFVSCRWDEEPSERVRLTARERSEPSAVKDYGPKAVTRRAAREQNVTEPSNPSLVLRSEASEQPLVLREERAKRSKRATSRMRERNERNEASEQRNLSIQGDSRLRGNDIKKDYFKPFEMGPHISTFGRESNIADPTDFRFISASALRGFSKFGRTTGTRTIR